MRVSRAVSALIGAAALLAGFAGTAEAATITVNTTDDELVAGGSCSLREALDAADLNSAMGGCTAGDPEPTADVIEVPAGVYTLTRSTPGEDMNDNGDLDIGHTNVVTASIRRAGPGAVTVDGNNTDRVFDLGNFSKITIDGLVIRNGSAGMTDTNLSGSAGAGGGIRNGGALTLLNSTVRDNRANEEGGGFRSWAVSADFTNVTFSGNEARGAGGGLMISGGATTLTNVTVTDNRARIVDGANSGGGGIRALSGTTLKSVIVAGNTDVDSVPAPAPDCSSQAGDLVSLGNTLIGDTTGCDQFTPGPGDVSGPANLGPLADNGGPTPTHALLAGSAALNQGGAGCPATDQRGLPRVLGDVCDIGAYERVTCSGVAVNRFGDGDDDTLIGTGAADAFLGLGGNDVTLGLGGNDTACGGAGNDRLQGAAGADLLLGGAGNDRQFGGAGRDRVFGEAGADRLIGGGGGDRLIGARGRDRLLGGGGRDLLKGGPGRDRLRGGKGRDKLRGGPGRDIQRQ